jgi:hypothetical protein
MPYYASFMFGRYTVFCFAFFSRHFLPFQTEVYRVKEPFGGAGKNMFFEPRFIFYFIFISGTGFYK